MDILLEKNKSGEVEDTTYAILKQVLSNSIKVRTKIITYEEATIDDLYKLRNNYPEKYKKTYPIGSYQFVSKWLRLFYNNTITPLYIPRCLQKYPFVTRTYMMVTPDRFPSHGMYFIKDITDPQRGSFAGSIANFQEGYLQPNQADHNFLIQSTIQNERSKWRVYVISREIKKIAHYEGDPCEFPDQILIKDAVNTYINTKTSPSSFVMDVVVTDKGTEIITLHPFVAVELYSTQWDDSLIDAYVEGLSEYMIGG